MARTLLALSLALGALAAWGDPVARAQRAETVQQLVGEARYQEAITAGRARVAEFEARGETDTPWFADALDDLASALYRTDNADVDAVLARSIAVRESIGDESALLSTLLLRNAAVRYTSDTIGRETAERALAIAERLLPPDHPTILDARSRVAFAQTRAGEYGAAEKAYRDVLEKQERLLAPDSHELVTTLRGLGATLGSLRKREESAAILSRALALEESRNDPFEAADTAGFLGQTLTEMGDYLAAKGVLTRGLAFAARSTGPASSPAGKILMLQGEIAGFLGNFDEALNKFLEARATSAHGFVSSRISTDLADEYMRLGQPDRALRSIQPAIEDAERSVAEGHVNGNVAATLSNYVNVLIATGRLEEARSYTMRALEMRRRMGLRLGESGEYQHLARIAAAEHDVPGASRWYARALDTIGPIGGPLVIDYESEYATFLARAGDLDAAQTHAAAASTAHVELIARVLRGLPEREAMLYTRNQRRDVDLDAALLEHSSPPTPSAVDRVFDLTVRSRALVLDEVARRQRPLASAEHAALRAELQTARERLARLAIQGAGGAGADFPRREHEAQAAVDRAEEALAAVSVDARQARDDARATGAAVVAGVAPGDALISYVRFTDRTGAIAADRYGAFVTIGRRVDYVRLGLAAPIDAAIAASRQQLLLEARANGRGAARLLADYRAAGSRLRRLVWDPLRAHLAESRRVFLVPDGALNLVSFAALPTGTSQFLVETGPTLHYLASERDLLRPARERRATALLAVGDPRFDAGTMFASLTAAGGSHLRAACGDFERLRFAPLPESGGEAAAIAGLWTRNARQADVLHGAAATETTLKQKASGYNVLHLATHGFFLGADCTASSTAADANPLVRSGVALAGANHRAAASDTEDDGVLTAAEVAGLDLSGLDWAVLSACDTGLGSIATGEGVIGLQRAFRIAGAATVVMSLWPVDDLATRAWMEDLYRARLKGATTADAVRTSTREVLAARRRAGESVHPFYWAGFIASGDWR